MEMEYLFSESKWEILSEISKESRSPLELSKIFNTTVANMSQQLRFLEAIGVVQKTKVQNSKKGKPRTRYSIKSELIYLIRLGKGIASKQEVKADPFNTFTVNVLTNLNKKEQYYLLKFFWTYAEILSKSSISLFKNNTDKIELFIITDFLEETRKLLSNQKILSPSGESKEIVCWSHNFAEIEKGLKDKDSHFINLIKKSSVLLDPVNLIEMFKEGLKNE